MYVCITNVLNLISEVNFLSFWGKKCIIICYDLIYLAAKSGRALFNSFYEY